mmetsp:Transcript_56688/g.99140  ORF Transcript_56688/g.99140 Transcript_56688/m.99140 type:complete len:436 (-) Transcript_56688:164-1471(-)
MAEAIPNMEGQKILRGVYSEPYDTPLKIQEDEGDFGIFETDPIYGGWAACAWLIFEGFALLAALSTTGWVTLNFVTSATSETNAMHASEKVFLYIMAYCDIIFAFLAFVSMWCSRNVLVDNWQKYGKGYAMIPTLAVGVLIAFRILVTLGLGPWVGIWLAFTPPDQDKFEACFWAFMYFAFCLFLLYVLLLAFRKAVAEGQQVQRYANEWAVEERMQLLINAHHVRNWGHPTDGESLKDIEVEPLIFGLFPLTETIAAYALLITMACVACLMEMGFWGGVIGGWAFFAEKGMDTSTYWLEIVLYILSIFPAAIGFLAAVSLLDKQARPPVTALFVFLLGSLARFSMMVPVTGMTLIANMNICGLYVRWLSNISTKTPWFASSPVHCGLGELGTICLVILVALLDGYLIWGVYQVWHHSRMKSLSLKDGVEVYGST